MCKLNELRSINVITGATLGLTESALNRPLHSHFPRPVGSSGKRKREQVSGTQGSAEAPAHRKRVSPLNLPDFAKSRV